MWVMEIDNDLTRVFHVGDMEIDNDLTGVFCVGDGD